jgi:hypothetical protein
LFPLNFVGNCIFATQPLFQCEDEGEEEFEEDFELEVEPFHDEDFDLCIDESSLPGSQNSLLSSLG